MNVDYIQHTGSDLSVVNAARVSFDVESEMEQNDLFGPPELAEKDARLISYLARHEHTSPFNHTFITLRVKAPLFVARQLVKHKFMPWNEISRRYVDSVPEFYWGDLRQAADNVKQGSGGYVGDKQQELTMHEFQRVAEGAINAYLNALDDGICAEQARMILPQNMYTEWYWSGTLGAWADMYKLRIDAHSQKETQEVAAMCGDIIAPLFPVAWKSLVT